MAAVWINNERNRAEVATAKALTENNKADAATQQSWETLVALIQMFRSPEEQYIPLDLTVDQMLNNAIEIFEAQENPLHRANLLAASSHALIGIGNHDRAIKYAATSWNSLSKMLEARQEHRASALNRLSNAYSNAGYFHKATDSLAKYLRIDLSMSAFGAFFLPTIAIEKLSARISSGWIM